MVQYPNLKLQLKPPTGVIQWLPPNCTQLESDWKRGSGFRYEVWKPRRTVILSNRKLNKDINYKFREFIVKLAKRNVLSRDKAIEYLKQIMTLIDINRLLDKELAEPIDDPLDRVILKIKISYREGGNYDDF